jgi:hypothetical protein
MMISPSICAMLPLCASALRTGSTGNGVAN